MKSSLFLLLTVFVSFQCIVQCLADERGPAYDVEEYGTNGIVKAKVALYMESLCPGCHQFIKHQLYPVFMKYSNYIQLDLIPFGNARHTKNSDGTWEFKCQHGEPECFGNLYLACATHLLQASRPKHLIRYYNCMASASSFSIEKDVKQCAPVAGVNFRKLQTCVKSKGPEILAQFGDRTDALEGRKFVPTIVIDDEFNIDDQGEIDDDLLGYLCQRFKGKKPTECNNKAAQVSSRKHHTRLTLSMRCSV